MKAMILAAGKGSRLRPITDTIPKPLVPIADKPLIEYTIEKLAKAGVFEIVINISYLGEKIKQVLGEGEKWGVHINYSEESEPLEVGGGIIKALPLLGNDPFIIINGDIWTDYPFEKLVKKAHHLNMLAHIVLVNNFARHPEGDFGIEGDRLISDGVKPKFTYSGMGIYTPEFFKGHTAGKVFLRPLLESAIKANTISAEKYEGEFNDVGTVESWEALNRTITEAKK